MLRPTWAYKLVPLKWLVSNARGTEPKAQGVCQQYIPPKRSVLPPYTIASGPVKEG